MLIIIKSAPGTPEGERGIKLARDMAADICLIQNAVCFSQKNRLKDFSGRVYVLNEDRRLRGIKDEQMAEDIKRIDYDGLVDLMVDKEKVVGVF